MLALLAARTTLVPAAEVLDRVVASIGNIAVTGRDVQQEYLFERLVDGEWPAPPATPATLDEVLKRLTYQKLLATQRRRSLPDLDDSQLHKAALEQLNGIRQHFASADDFHAALQTLGMSEQEILERITAHERILRLIDQRLRPVATPGDPEVDAYYRDTFVPEYKKRGQGNPPTLQEVEGQIREVLIQKRINVLLSQWLEELRNRRNVVFHNF